jgi:probable rRNA maturation factor
MNQARLTAGQRVPKAVVDRTLRACEQALRLKKDADVSIAFVSPAEMKKLNKTWRGKDGLTDVLSFGDIKKDGDGEIILSYEQAKRQAAQLRHSVRDEIVFLLVHGVLHLYGHDHEQLTDAKKMFGLQTKILIELGVDPRI